MFSKFAQRIRRRPSQLQRPPPEGVVVVPEASGCETRARDRQIVEIAPDLEFGRCDLETPFPSVAFGGYIRYYRATGSMNDDLPSPTQSISRRSVRPSPPPPPPPPPTTSTSMTTTTTTALSLFANAMDRPPKSVDRQSRRYSFSGSISASAKSAQVLRWKRATCIVTSSIAAHHHRHPTLTLTGPDGDTPRPPSFDSILIARSRCESSDESSTVLDSLGFEAVESEDAAAGHEADRMVIKVGAIRDGDRRGDDVGMLLRRPLSASTFWTAKSA